MLRTHDEVSRFFAGLELLDPGVVLVDQWRPDPDAAAHDGPMLPIYGGVARKPWRPLGGPLPPVPAQPMPRRCISSARNSANSGPRSSRSSASSTVARR